MKSFDKAAEILDDITWPVGFKYALTNDLLEFIVFRENVRQVSTTIEGLVHLEKMINNAMIHLKSINPACKLVVK